jgi:hypothetical protein
MQILFPNDRLVKVLPPKYPNYHIEEESNYRPEGKKDITLIKGYVQHVL